MAKFRVLAGKHSEGRNEDGSPRVYKKGDIVDSKTDLLKHNTPVSRKFEAVDEGPRPLKSQRTDDQAQRTQEPTQRTGEPQSPPSTSQPSALKGQPPPRNEREYVASLEKMTVEELKAHAAEEEIDLKNANTKPEILKVIRASLGK